MNVTDLSIELNEDSSKIIELKLIKAVLLSMVDDTDDVVAVLGKAKA